MEAGVEAGVEAGEGEERKRTKTYHVQFHLLLHSTDQCSPLSK